MIAHPKIMIIFFIFVGGVQHKKNVFKEILPPCGTCRYRYSSGGIALKRVTLKSKCVIGSSDLLSAVLEEPGELGVDIILDPCLHLAHNLKYPKFSHLLTL